MNEIWKPIPNFEGYFASSLGRIRDENERILNQYELGGYIGVSLNSYGQYLVHRLICSAFHENPANKREVNHINGIKTDNRASNLEWVTHQENIQHAIRTGLMTYHPLSEEHKKKISESNKGKQRSEEAKHNYSESKKGNKNPNYGKSLSEEIRNKLSKSLKGRHLSEETRRNMSKPKSKEHCKKIVITNEVVSIFIFPEDFPEWESKGYRRGYKKIPTPLG